VVVRHILTAYTVWKNLQISLYKCITMGTGCYGYITKTYVNINYCPAPTVTYNEISLIFLTVYMFSIKSGQHLYHFSRFYISNEQKLGRQQQRDFQTVLTLYSS
jgi:hypothetical protein